MDKENEILISRESRNDETEVMNPLVLKLKRPFVFESKEYNTINLTKLDEWSCDDLVKVTKKYNALTGGDTNPIGAILPESNLEYCEFVAAEASGLPIDFFKQLKARESGPLKSLIINFFHGTV